MSAFTLIFVGDPAGKASTLRANERDWASSQGFNGVKDAVRHLVLVHEFPVIKINQITPLQGPAKNLA